MADIKWIKITTDIFDDEKIKIIDRMPARDEILVIWFKLLTLSGKVNQNGMLFMNNKIAYTTEMLSAVFNREENSIKMALKIFENFGMIDIEDNVVIKISNWEKHQNVETMEKIREQTKKRVERHREKQRLMLPEHCNVTSNVTVTQGNATEREREEEREKKESSNIASKNDAIDSSKLLPIIESWNLLNLHQIKSLKTNTTRYKLLKARLQEYSIDEILTAIEHIKASPFLRGQNERGWTITFDWFIKPNNFTKVYEGNYVKKKAIKQNSKTQNLYSGNYSNENDDLEAKLLNKRGNSHIKQ